MHDAKAAGIPRLYGTITKDAEKHRANQGIELVSLAPGQRLRPLGHKNTHNLMVLIVGIENARALHVVK